MLTEALATTGLPWLVLAAFLAGIVRGFAGFGTAMVFMPVAARVTDPVAAVVMLVTIDLIGPLPNLPRALRDGHPPDLLRLALGLVVCLPLGAAFLTSAPVEVFRLTVSVLTLVLLALLLAGIRYRGQLRPPLVVGAGALSGLLGGATTLFGPPVILFYMASALKPAAIRANLLVYLVFTNVAFIGLLALRGLISLEPFVIAALLIVPYVLANILGAAIFRPEAGRTWRAVAYTIIAVSALSGLPFFG